MIESTNATDGQTDGRADGQLTMTMPRYATLRAVEAVKDRSTAARRAQRRPSATGHVTSSIM